MSQTIEDFAEMAERYNTTKPVISKNHTRKDNIRPVGRRSRKWEHMIKVSARQYIIYDGYQYGDPKFQAWGSSTPPTEKETLALAPIMWTLSPMGDIETIRIRNGSGDYAHCSRYSFFENTLPRGLVFIVRNGKQYIKTNKLPNAEKPYLLPKSKYIPPHQAFNGCSSPSETYKDDKKYLTFARKVGGDRYSWEVIGDTWDVRNARKQVDKKAKAKIKPYTDAFYEWITTMYRLIPFTDYEYQYKMEKELRKDGFSQSYLRTIICDDQHPLRLAIAVDFLSQSSLNAGKYIFADRGKINEPKTQADISKLRSEWNRYVNEKCGLVKQVAAEKIVKGEKR